ncbi:MAG: DUF5320 domain-containing protein [Bacteroidales bacterium]|nr:DUF5320 domain-containing protein [Bacteroidales bacterium]MDY0196237.1 DUF5320 domain-containing protein [Tenuifilaceae bacterium]
MPGFNQKGPAGQGPMTGRRMGKCTNFGVNQKSQIADEETQTNNFGRGFGFGRRGCGRGFNRGFGMQNRFRGGF